MTNQLMSFKTFAIIAHGLDRMDRIESEYGSQWNSSSFWGPDADQAYSHDIDSMNDQPSNDL